MDGLLELQPSQWSLVEALRAQVARHGDAPYVNFDGGKCLSFAALDRVSDACATGLARLGVGPGDRVLIVASNCLEFLVAFWGVQKRRAILVPINVELKGELLTHQLRDSAPKLIITDRDIAELSTTKVESVEGVVRIGNSVEKFDDKPSISFEMLCSETDPDFVLTPAASDTCLILYTSGTSGRSKGVLIPQAHAYLFGLQQARVFPVSEEDRFFIALPMFHVNALLMSLGACLVSGSQAFIVPKFSASQWLDQVRACQATVTNCLGIMAEFILRQPETARDRDHGLRAIMAVPVSAIWAERFESRFGTRLLQVYGMTECNIVSFTRPEDSLEPGCVGAVSDEYFDLQIVDNETDRPVTEGAVGEIVIRPKVASAFMQGYFGLPDVTVHAWRNLWFHTGDAGWLDKSGRLHFVDRLGDCLRRRGENISSSEIEQVLASHPAIAECCVVGVKVEGAGGEDEIMAYVVRAAPAHYVDLIAWSAPRLPRYAVPRFWEFVDALDKTPTGKIKKKELRSRGVTTATWDSELQRRNMTRDAAKVATADAGPKTR